MDSLAHAHESRRERTVDRILPILGGHVFFQTLSAAVQLDLFGLLEKKGPLSLADIAKHLGLAPKPARILIMGCTALALLSKKGDSYANGEGVAELLVRERPGSLVPIIEWQHFINYRALYHYFDALVANRNVGLDTFPGDEPTLYGRLVHQPDLERIFQKAMEAISNRANGLLAEHVDFSPFQHVVDVGGGNGTNLIRLAKKFPELRGTVFDAASVCEIAARNIQQAGLEHRLGTAAGNCFSDPFPPGADCILFAHFFTIWSEERNAELLRKCHAALPKGGAAVVFNMMLSDTEDGPLSAALGSPYFLTLATGEGMLYPWKDYELWMREAGYDSVKIQKLPYDHGIVTGFK